MVNIGIHFDQKTEEHYFVVRSGGLRLILSDAATFEPDVMMITTLKGPWSWRLERVVTDFYQLDKPIGLENREPL